jgi:PAS domain S-box-containing protein
MSFFSFLHFFNTIVYLYLAAYIFIKNPKALVNRLCVPILLCFGIWSFSLIFIHNSHSSKNIARLFINISSLGWGSFSSFFLLFILVFTGKRKILKKKWLYLLLFGIPLVFIYKQWTGYIFVDLSKAYYGWKPLFSSSGWPCLFLFYYLSFVGTGLYININFIRNIQNTVLRKQAKIIFITVLIALILGTFTDVLLPLLNIYVTPHIADFIILIWAFGVVYAMAKYKFLTITPVTAASNIISTMFDCLILLTLTGEIVTANKATLNLLGYNEDELKGASVNILFPEEVLNNGLAQKIVSEGDLENKDFVLKTKKGKEIPVILSSSILRDNAGVPGGIVCVARDISERKTLEEEILKSKKLESIGILAGGIAHDFNNLFSVIMGNIMLAMEEVSPKKKVYNFLVKAEEVSLKAVDLANKFITFSREGCLKRGKVTLSTLLKNARNSELPGTRENIYYKIDIPEDLMPIDGDKEQLGEVMQNLLLNACEAISNGHSDDGGEEEGRISVRAENMTVNAESKLLLKKGEYVKVLIEDNGIGIPQRNIEKVFEPYFSTKNKMNQKGMGLGLTICYSIIKKHGGHITVESEGRKGTTVTLYLPAFIDRNPPPGF